MDHVKLLKEEARGNIVYTFSLAYTNKSDELDWVEGVMVATKDKKGDWTYATDTAKLNQNQFNTYRTLVDKVNQVVETNGMNVAGIKVVHPKPE